MIGAIFFLAGVFGLSTLTTCGPEVHPATTQAIIDVESSGNPLAIHDNDTGTSYTPSSRTEAAEIASRLLKSGRSIDMGLMQINSWHLRKKKIDHESLFDPCTNIRVGTEILADFYYRHRDKNPKDSPDLILLKALSSYNTGTPYKGTRYVTKILKKARGIDCLPTHTTRLVSTRSARTHSLRTIPCEPINAITFYRKDDAP
ncbi:MAG: lytic transglycosylase domain-containing protein [Syntrophobacterales bacterium]|jgi:type IV secretion system protein VirB1|nr:lytic transglycosylase domain-containing protein [Syntrophobacterales bacterium]